jgi:hypothetical protein
MSLASAFVARRFAESRICRAEEKIERAILFDLFSAIGV